MPRDQRRESRLKIDEGYKVVIGSIGSDVRYDLSTKDFSVAGLYVDFEDPRRFPFTTSSIMEIWIELAPDRAVFFNGKVARINYEPDNDEGKGPGIAIRIVQIDSEQQDLLSNYSDSQSQDDLQKAS
jgi:hypothetical protein